MGEHIRIWERRQARLLLLKLCRWHWVGCSGTSWQTLLPAHHNCSTLKQAQWLKAGQAANLLCSNMVVAPTVYLCAANGLVHHDASVGQAPALPRLACCQQQ